MKKWDAIVVGAGNGGLVAAARLAQKKKKVLLIEQHNLPGGFATSFKRGRFEFEASLHELCGFGKNPGEGSVRKIFEEIGVADKIDWVDIPEAFRLITMQDEDNLDVNMPFGVETFIDKMEQEVPGSRESMERLFSLGRQVIATTDFMGEIGGNYNLDAIKAIVGEHMNFVRVSSYSVNQVLDVIGVPERARRIFTSYWSYLGEHCDDMNFIHYMSMVMSYLNGGAVIPKGRSHEMSTAILERFTELGGEVWFNSKVSEILVSEGRAKGIRLSDGTSALSDNVICDCSPHLVFSTMIDKSKIPAADIKRTNARKFGARGFAMFLGLNKSPDELGVKDHCYFLYDTADSVKQYDMMKRLETNNVQATVCLNRADPDCSPEGTTIMYFTSLFMEDCWGKVSVKDYVKTKRMIAQRMIDNFEKYTGARIRDAIEEIEIATPMTYARYTGTPQGTIYGYRSQGWDNVVARTMMDDMDEKIPGLSFVGGFSTQMIGYSSSLASGYNAAKKVVR